MAEPVTNRNDSVGDLPQEIAVVILNWNAAEDTLACVAQFAGWQTLAVHIWVVDNGSSDTDALRGDEAFHLIRNPQNLGFSGGTNRGIEAALAAGSRPILLLNNDARIDETSAQQLLHTITVEPNAGVVGPLLYSATQPRRLLSAGGKNPVLHLQTRHQRISSQPTVWDVAQISGTAVLLHPGMLQEIGLLDEAYFFSTEMADLCRRAKMSGYRVVVDGSAQALHALERSMALRGTLYTYYIIRNRFLYIRKFYPRAGFLLRMIWRSYGFLLANKLERDGQHGTATAVRLGTADGLAGRFGGQNQRVLEAIR